MTSVRSVFSLASSGWDGFPCDSVSCPEHVQEGINQGPLGRAGCDSKRAFQGKPALARSQGRSGHVARCPDFEIVSRRKLLAFEYLKPVITALTRIFSVVCVDSQINFLALQKLRPQDLPDVLRELQNCIAVKGIQKDLLKIFEKRDASNEDEAVRDREAGVAVMKFAKLGNERPDLVHAPGALHHMLPFEWIVGAYHCVCELVIVMSLHVRNVTVLNPQFDFPTAELPHFHPHTLANCTSTIFTRHFPRCPRGFSNLRETPYVNDH